MTKLYNYELMAEYLCRLSNAWVMNDSLAMDLYETCPSNLDIDDIESVKLWYSTFVRKFVTDTPIESGVLEMCAKDFQRSYKAALVLELEGRVK